MANLFGDLGSILGNQTLTNIGNTNLGNYAASKVLNTSVQPEIKEVRTESSSNSSPMTNGNGKKYLPWIIGGVVLLIGMIFFLRKK